MRLQDKVAIVTGGGSGFGEGIAKAYAREGASIVVADIGEAGGLRVVEEIKAAGGRAVFAKADVSKRADMDQLLATALEHFGKLDIVVNNAGTTHRNRPMLEVEEDEFDRVYAVNVKSIFLSAKTFVPYFRQVGGGASSTSPPPPACARVRA
jgi:3-oxoacyl-[acyl-carrier protein] reductase